MAAECWCGAATEFQKHSLTSWVVTGEKTGWYMVMFIMYQPQGLAVRQHRHQCLGSLSRLVIVFDHMESI